MKSKNVKKKFSMIFEATEEQALKLAGQAKAFLGTTKPPTIKPIMPPKAKPSDDLAHKPIVVKPPKPPTVKPGSPKVNKKKTAKKKIAKKRK